MVLFFSYTLLYLHKTLIVCVDTTFSVSCIFNPWHTTTSERLCGSIVAVMFDIVIQPPVRTKKKEKERKKRFVRLNMQWKQS